MIAGALIIGGAGVSSVDVKVDDGTTLKGARRVLVERAISKR